MEKKSGSMNEKMFSQEHDTERTINKKDNKAKNEVLTYIRDYRVMTNLKYRLITNILIPVLAIFTSMLISCSKTVWAWIGVIVIVYDFYMMCEVVQDYFCFGCMCKKNAFGMHFLKTGFNGVRYFENAVLVDILIIVLHIYKKIQELHGGGLCRLASSMAVTLTFGAWTRATCATTTCATTMVCGLPFLLYLRPT